MRMRSVTHVFEGLGVFRNPNYILEQDGVQHFVLGSPSEMGIILAYLDGELKLVPLNAWLLGAPNITLFNTEIEYSKTPFKPDPQK
jgi:hypothetical protein